MVIDILAAASILKVDGESTKGCFAGALTIRAICKELAEAIISKPAVMSGVMQKAGSDVPEDTEFH